MDYYIGIDSGGTKTEAVVVDESGHIRHRLLGKGCNPMDIGTKAAQETILSIVDALRERMGAPAASLYAGIAGANHVDMGLEEILASRRMADKIRIEDDRRMVISSTLGHVEGCGLICGTGSSLTILKENCSIRQVGGLGYLIDTGGSGFELGQAALKHSCRYLDGRGKYTALVPLVTEALGKSPWEAMNEIYSGGRAFIASLAHTVFDGMAMGDALCREIVENAAYSLAELTFVAEKYFDGEFPVVMTGGILSRYPEYVEMICAKASGKAKMIMSVTPPVYGAVAEALWQSGKTADDGTKKCFMEDYRRILSQAAAGPACCR